MCHLYCLCSISVIVIYEVIHNMVWSELSNPLPPKNKQTTKQTKQKQQGGMKIWGSQSIIKGTQDVSGCGLPLQGAFTLLTLQFLKSQHFDPTIYTCAKTREVSWNWNFTIFWLVVRICDHRLQSMHSCMQRMQYAWGPRISIHVSKSACS